MYFNMGFMAVNYLDDFVGAEVPDKAIEGLRKTFFFLNHDSTNNEISKILSIVTSKVNFSESNNTPKNIILVVDSTLFLRLLEATGK
jgi:hypothetical protein